MGKARSIVLRPCGSLSGRGYGGGSYRLSLGERPGRGAGAAYLAYQGSRPRHQRRCAMIADVPRHITQRILDGEGPIQVWREYRCLSIPALAKKVGLNPAAVMELEIEGQGADGALLTD